MGSPEEDSIKMKQEQPQNVDTFKLGFISKKNEGLPVWPDFVLHLKARPAIGCEAHLSSSVPAPRVRPRRPPVQSSAPPSDLRLLSFFSLCDSLSLVLQDRSESHFWHGMSFPNRLPPDCGFIAFLCLSYSM